MRTAGAVQFIGDARREKRWAKEICSGNPSRRMSEDSGEGLIVFLYGSLTFRSNET